MDNVPESIADYLANINTADNDAINTAVENMFDNTADDPRHSRVSNIKRFFYKMIR